MSFFGEKPDFDLSLSSTLAHNWTVVAARGVFGIIIGLIAFLFPGPTLLSLVGLFAVFLIIDGILAIVAAVRAASKSERWGFLTFEGIAGIAAGILAMAMPGLTVFVFVGLLATWAFVSGWLELRAAFNLATDHGRWWLALSGIISIVFGIVLIAAPMFGALVVTWWVGAYATFFGASLLALGFKLRARKAGSGTQGGTRRA
ncbi:MAG: HdeD family acid-resistance protein [Methylocella sp.]